MPDELNSLAGIYMYTSLKRETNIWLSVSPVHSLHAHLPFTADQETVPVIKYPQQLNGENTVLQHHVIFLKFSTLIITHLFFTLFV